MNHFNQTYWHSFRVLMHCSYTGNFNSLHKKDKRRRLNGVLLEDATRKLVDECMKPSEYLKQEARKYMNLGNN